MIGASTLSALVVCLGSAALFTPPAAVQTTPPERLEVPDDPPGVPARTSAPGVALPARGLFAPVQVNVDGAGNNITGDAANEPSIAVNLLAPNQIAIGWRQFDTVASNFRQAGWGYTRDGGRTWTFPGVIEPGIFRSDPVLDHDADGNIYYNSLTSNAGGFSTDVFKSTDGGMTWDNGVFAWGGDKQWMVIDRTNGIGRGNIYANWTLFFSSCNGQFTRSYDGGQTFLECIDVPGTPQWGTLAVGPDGELYVAGRGFVVVKSSTMQDENLPPQWDFAAPVDLTGPIVRSTGPNPGGLLGQAWVATDNSDGPTRGNVYLLSSVDPPGSDPCDVMFARSTDGGQTWSSAVRVNDDPGTSAWQWFGTMSVAPNGRIDVVFNDTRNDPGGFDSELHYTFSLDAGQNWAPNMAVSPSFDPHLGWPQQNKIGDYYDMVSDLVGAHVAFAATFNGEQDVYYLRINDYDCNGNGVPDTEDINTGTSADCNGNTIPDECEEPPPCPGNVNGDCDVNVLDLLALLAAWGPCPGCPEDVNGDGIVDVLDLLELLAAWGPCP